jgi:hypothetical protein
MKTLVLSNQESRRQETFCVCGLSICETGNGRITLMFHFAVGLRDRKKFNMARVIFA